MSDFSFGDVSHILESSFGDRAHSTSDPEKKILMQHTIPHLIRNTL